MSGKDVKRFIARFRGIITRLVECFKGESFAKTFTWEVAFVAGITLSFYNIDWITEITRTITRAIPFEMNPERALFLGLTVLFWMMVGASLAVSMIGLISSLKKRLKNAPVQ